MKNKRMVLFCAVLMMGLGLSLSSGAALQNITIITAQPADDQSTLLFKELDIDNKIISQDGALMIPARKLSEVLELSIQWNEKDREVILSRGNKQITFSIGKFLARTEKENISLVSSPILIKGTSYLPLRIVAEYFDQYIFWQKGEGGNQLIWISCCQLLKDEDTQEAGYVQVEEGIPYYKLKDTAATSRKIKIGDKEGEVIEAYGPPHAKSEIESESYLLYYFSPAIPNTDSGSILSFAVNKGVVEEVFLDQ